MRHGRPLAAFAASLALAAAWVLALAAAGAHRVAPGESVVAVFPRGESAARVVSHLAAAPARRFEPLGVANAWIVQADGTALAAALKARGALFVLQAKGPLHFALGCATTPPLRAAPAAARAAGRRPRRRRRCMTGAHASGEEISFERGPGPRA